MEACGGGVRVAEVATTIECLAAAALRLARRRPRTAAQDRQAGGEGFDPTRALVRRHRRRQRVVFTDSEPPPHPLTPTPASTTRQPLFPGALPLVVNVTVLNGMGVSGWIDSAPKWKPGKNGHALQVRSRALRRRRCSAGLRVWERRRRCGAGRRPPALDWCPPRASGARRSAQPHPCPHAPSQLRFSYSRQLWPWSGYLALYISARTQESGAGSSPPGGEAFFEGVAEGEVELVVTAERRVRGSSAGWPSLAILTPARLRRPSSPAKLRPGRPR